MGIFQPGGAGTQVNVYDDADATNHPAAPGPHTWAEINAAFPLAFAILQTAAGATYSASRVQYLCVTDLFFGDPLGGTNFTSLVDVNSDIYSPTGTTAQTRLRFTAAVSANLTKMVLGEPIGAGERMVGKKGCNIYATSSLRFRCTLGLYGCYVESTANMQFVNLGSDYQEIAGCVLFVRGGGGNNFVFGTADAGPITMWNTAVASESVFTMCSSIQVSDSANVVLGCAVPQNFYSSASPLRKFTRMSLSGAPTISDTRFTSGTGYQLTNFGWSNTPGIPRMTLPNDVTADNGQHEFWSIDTKVVDENGLSVAGVPIFASNDVEGDVLDTITQGDGNIVFTYNPTGKQNVLPVRDWYTVGATVRTRERTYTVTVNGYMSGIYQPNPNYQTRQFQFKWPGIDLYGTSYQANGGTFKPIDDIIMLSPGVPTKGSAWTECSVPLA